MKFKVGDTVRVIRDCSQYFATTIGKTGTERYCVKIPGIRFKTYFFSSEIELVDTPAQTLIKKWMSAK